MNLLPLKRAASPGAAWCLSVAGAMLVLCLGAGLFLYRAGNVPKSHRVPAGQFSADIRSLFAAARFLLDPAGDEEPIVPLTRGRPGTLAVKPVMHSYPTYSYSSNQVGLPEPFTNRPARS